MVDIPEMYIQGLRLMNQPLPEDPSHERYVHRLLKKAAKSALFLDHQGVMRTQANEKQTSRQLAAFSPSAVQALNRLLDTDPSMDIVVSSDWKEWVPLQSMADFYAAQGIHRRPIGYTPTLPRGKTTAAERRAREIRAWLDMSPEHVKWVAIDDLDLSPYMHASNFMCVSAETGITTMDVEALLAVARASTAAA